MSNLSEQLRKVDDLPLKGSEKSYKVIRASVVAALKRYRVRFDEDASCYELLDLLYDKKPDIQDFPTKAMMMALRYERENGID